MRPDTLSRHDLTLFTACQQFGSWGMLDMKVEIRFIPRLRKRRLNWVWCQDENVANRIQEDEQRNIRTRYQAS